MDTYEFNGEKYKKASRHQKEWGTRLISSLNLDGNEAVLDLGCGDGILTEQLSLLVPDGRAVGIDASAGMINTARKLQKENLQFIHMNIADMSFEEEFDIIFSNAALHWVKDHRHLLKCSYAALKPGGKIIWNFAGSGNCSDFFEAIRRISETQQFKPYFSSFEWPWYMPSKTEYEGLMNQTEFICTEITEENADRYFMNTEEMIRWIDQPSIVPFIERIPEGLKEDYRNKVIEASLRTALQPDGTCFQPFRRLRVSACKDTFPI
ncbi:MAG: methyltransferase domain-containing protein [Anaerostipes sp.]|nr:methyltransferase domain-containing protein [Anaerostipes sp.]